MLKYILGFISLVILVIVGMAFSQPNTFNYERSGVINAKSEVIFPYLNNFKIGGEWSPYEKIDPNMKKTYSGPETGVGSVMEFAGNKEAGAGRLEIKKEILNEMVEIELEMIEPFHGVNTIFYKLTSEQEGTRFTWSMSGQNNFLSKLVSVFIDCDKMVGDQFSEGIQNLKMLIESRG